MFLIDDILLSPITGLLSIFRELHKAVKQDSANESEAIRTELSELYMLLETAQITEAEADARETELLDRLDEVEARRQNNGADDQDEDQDEDEEPPDDEDNPVLDDRLKPSELDGP